MDALNEEKRALERELDAVRSKAVSGDGSDSGQVALLEKERELLREQYDAELAFLKKQVADTATAQDTALFVDQLKAAHTKKMDALQPLVAQLQQKQQQYKDREIESLTRDNKRLRQYLDKTLSKEKLAELIED